MDKRIQELEKGSKLYKKQKINRKHYIPYFLYLALIIGPIYTWLVFPEMFSQTIQVFEQSLNQGIFLSVSTSFGATLLAGFYEANSFSQYKKFINKENGLNSELEFLKVQIEKERKVLESLKSEKTKDSERAETKAFVVEVDDAKQLEELEKRQKLYYHLGYNEKKYYQYYQNGQLDSKLEHKYGAEGVQVAEEYIKQKAPALVLRKKNNNSQK